ncbi:hypothetical protein D3C80_2179500 [compost metagenome]
MMMRIDCFIASHIVSSKIEMMRMVMMKWFCSSRTLTIVSNDSTIDCIVVVVVVVSRVNLE